MLQKGAIGYQTPGRIESDDAWGSFDELDLWREGDEVGAFTCKEIAYLVEQGCMDARVQIRPECSDDLFTLDDVAGELSTSAAPDPALDEKPASIWPKSLFDSFFVQGCMSPFEFLLRSRLVSSGPLVNKEKTKG